MRPTGLIEKAFILKKSDLFADIDLDLLLSLADKSGVGHFNPGESIFNAGQEGTRLYIVAEGRIGLYNRENTKLLEVIPPDFFGDEALFNNRPRGYSATALERSVLLSLSKTHLMSFINECPMASLNLMGVWAASTDYRSR